MSVLKNLSFTIKALYLIAGLLVFSSVSGLFYDTQVKTIEIEQLKKTIDSLSLQNTVYIESDTQLIKKPFFLTKNDTNWVKYPTFRIMKRDTIFIMDTLEVKKPYFLVTPETTRVSQPIFKIEEFKNNFISGKEDDNGYKTVTRKRLKDNGKKITVRYKFSATNKDTVFLNNLIQQIDYLVDERFD